MNIETVFIILFLFILGAVLYTHRSKLAIQKVLWPFIYIGMFKTSAGLKQMDALAKKHPRIVGCITTFGIYAGLLGMAAISYMLLENLYGVFFVPQTLAGVSLVLPFKVEGSFYVPFFYWIISIFVIASIHEFSHGVAARLHNVPIKSSGFAFLSILVPIIPAAFVEPDEKILSKKTLHQKLGVFAAGPISNILTGLLFLGAFIALSYPIGMHVINFDGITVHGYTPNSSAELSGLPKGSIITRIDEKDITQVDNLTQALQEKNVGDVVTIITNNGTYLVSLGAHPQNASLPYLGITVAQHHKIRESFSSTFGSFTATGILWILSLLYWLYVLSIGIGLFNLVPIGIVDGGQMTRELFKRFIKNEQTAMRVWHYVSLFFFVVILLTLTRGFF